jgi:hypothetical protein
MPNQKSDWEEELKKLDAIDFRTNVQESFHQVMKASAVVAVVMSTVSSKNVKNEDDDGLNGWYGGVFYKDGIQLHNYD